MTDEDIQRSLPDNSLLSAKNVHNEVGGIEPADLTNDACCVNPGWGNPPPPEHAYPQAYANLATGSCLGQIRSTEANDLFNQGYQAAMGERNYQDEARRNQALAHALEYARADRKVTADGIVTVAKAFHVFLKGE